MSDIDRRTVLAAGAGDGCRRRRHQRRAARPGGARRERLDSSLGPAAGQSTPLARAADLPRGGGVVLPDHGVVLTRSTDDVVAGFSAVCTHQGCLVSSVSEGAIHCTCHGSRFDASTGEVLAGPARQALAGVPLALEGDTIVTA